MHSHILPFFVNFTVKNEYLVFDHIGLAKGHPMRMHGVSYRIYGSIFFSLNWKYKIRDRRIFCTLKRIEKNVTNHR